MSSVRTEPATTGAPATGHLSVAHGAAVSIGAVLGTGVVGLPALGAQVAGPASLIAWAVLILLSVPLASTFAALGARYPDAGGVSTYVRRAFGARAAAVVGWCFYFAVATGAPAAALFAGAYVAAAFGGGRDTELVTCAGLILLVAASNAGGVKVSGRVQLILAATLAVMLVVTTVLALPHAHAANLHPFAPYGWTAIAPAAAVLVWGFAGWEAVTSLAADFTNPRRSVPRATAVAVLVVGVLYLLIAATSILVLGPRTGTTPAPLAELLAIAVGGPVKVITAVIAVLLTFGAMNAYFAGASKLGAALGRDGALPSWLAHGSEVGDIPRRSLAVLAGMATLALVVVTVGGIDVRRSVLITTGSFVLVYILGTAAAVKLLPRRSLVWVGAVIALVSAIGLLVITGFYVLWPLMVAGAALVYNWRRSRVPAGAREPLAQTGEHG